MFGGHNHSHGPGGHGHSHSQPNFENMDPQQRAQMQRQMMAMRNAILNGQMPQFPQNMPPHMIERAQEQIRQFQQQIRSQNIDSASFLPPIAMPMQSAAANDQQLIDKDPTCNPISIANCDDQLNTNGVIQKQAEATHNAAIAQEDYSKFDIVKATQYGALDRCRELIESGQVDVNKPDGENVYLLHWAAINNRVDIAKYYIERGAYIDPVGGELESTPLHWAARHGHIKIVILLMNSGANPSLYDNEGFSTIHLAAMFGHSNVVAYLLAKGIDPDQLDQNNNATALMYAAQRIHNRDPAQLLITFNARINAQDKRGNTPIHYAIQFNNMVVLRILVDKGASINIPNNTGLNALQFAVDRKKPHAAFMLSNYANDDKDSLPSIVRPFSKNKDIRKLFTRLFPFITLFHFGFVFDMEIWFLYKLILCLLFYPVFYAFRVLFFDKNLTKYVPMATACAFIFWLLTTWFIYFRPLVFDLSFYSIFFVVSIILSWYNLYKAYKTNPGIIKANRDQINKSIIQFLELSEISLEQFCTSCVVRKPLRSKHCSECDHCVSKFDHHCPWVDNCIGQFNLKYFLGFIFWTPVTIVYYMHGAIVYYGQVCVKSSNVDPTSTLDVTWKIITCSPWVTFFTVIASFNLFWISCLCICHIYQIFFAALTTNERMNLFRYKHFMDRDGNYYNPFNFGFIQNAVDLFEIRFLSYKPSGINWIKEYDVEDLINAKLLKKPKNDFYPV